MDFIIANWYEWMFNAICLGNLLGTSWAVAQIHAIKASRRAPKKAKAPHAAANS
jgi:hypothetical protein